MLFFPFQTTGSFFSTWNGFYYWFAYAFIAFELRRIKIRMKKILISGGAGYLGTFMAQDLLKNYKVLYI